MTAHEPAFAEQEECRRPRPTALGIAVRSRHRMRTTQGHGAEDDAHRVEGRHRRSVLPPDHDGHPVRSDRQSAVIDAEDRHLPSQAKLRPPDPVVQTPAESPRGRPSGPAAAVTLARALGVSRRRPGAQRLLTRPAAAPEESPALVRQLQRVDVELRNAGDAPAEEHRGGDIVVPVEGERDVSDATTQSCLTRWRRSLQEAHALGQRVVHHAGTVLGSHGPWAAVAASVGA